MAAIPQCHIPSLHFLLPHSPPVDLLRPSAARLPPSSPPGGREGGGGLSSEKGLLFHSPLSKRGPPPSIRLLVSLPGNSLLSRRRSPKTSAREKVTLQLSLSLLDPRRRLCRGACLPRPQCQTPSDVPPWLWRAPASGGAQQEP